MTSSWPAWYRCAVTTTASSSQWLCEAAVLNPAARSHEVAAPATAAASRAGPHRPAHPIHIRFPNGIQLCRSLWGPGLIMLQCAPSDGERGFQQAINKFVETGAVGHGSIVCSRHPRTNRRTENSSPTNAVEVRGVCGKILGHASAFRAYLY
jgi:hypothetical protein